MANFALLKNGVSKFVASEVNDFILDGSENSWMVMSTTPQIFLDVNEHYHPRIFTALQNHIKSVK
jgi:hypothetical protein